MGTMSHSALIFSFAYNRECKNKLYYLELYEHFPHQHANHSCQPMPAGMKEQNAAGLTPRTNPKIFRSVLCIMDIQYIAQCGITGNILQFVSVKCNIALYIQILYIQRKTSVRKMYFHGLNFTSQQVGDDINLPQNLLLIFNIRTMK